MALGERAGQSRRGAWRFVGSKLAQIPTPDKVSGWQERDDIYLCALIIACATIAWMGRVDRGEIHAAGQGASEVVKEHGEPVGRG